MDFRGQELARVVMIVAARDAVVDESFTQAVGETLIDKEHPWLEFDSFQ